MVIMVGERYYYALCEIGHNKYVLIDEDGDKRISILKEGEYTKVGSEEELDILVSENIIHCKNKQTGCMTKYTKDDDEPIIRAVIKAIIQSLKEKTFVYSIHFYEESGWKVLTEAYSDDKIKRENTFERRKDAEEVIAKIKELKRSTFR